MTADGADSPGPGAATHTSIPSNGVGDDKDIFGLGAVLTPAQEEALAAMKAKAEAHETFGGQLTYCDPVILQRFLIFKNYRVDHGYEAWEKWAKWKAEAKPETFTADMPGVHDLLNVRRKAYIDGVDKWGRPSVVVHMQRHVKGDEWMPLCVYLLETSLQYSRQHADGYSNHILDYEGISFRHYDTAMLPIIPFLKAYYPETCRRFFLLHTNVVFRFGYRLLSPLVPERVKQKLVFITELEQLLEYFNLGELPAYLRERIEAQKAD